MKQISKSKLKAHMLQVFREIEASGEPVIVTDRGKPTIRIEPVSRSRPVEELFADLQGKVRFTGDPNEPTTDEWEEA